MAKPVKLPNGRSWTKLGDAKGHFKTILGGLAVGGRVSSPQDHADLLALVTLYDHDLPAGADTKSGAGIDYFYKDHAGGPGYSTECFYIMRMDGTHIDFSYIRALESAAKQTT